MFQSPGSIFLRIGPLAIHWYGLIIAGGIALCYWYAISESKRRGLSAKHIDDMAFLVILAGIVGARLYYVLFQFSSFSANPLEILKIWNGGLAIHGALIGGAIAFFTYVIRQKLSWTLYADIIIPGVLLAQAIGRWGNFFNSEAFGRPTDLPWKLFIPLANRPAGYESFSYFHPTFLYESLWNFVGFLILVFLTRRWYGGGRHEAGGMRPSGLIFCAYLIWYSFGRFFIEGLRMDSLYLGPFRIAQIVSALLFFGAIFGLLFLIKKFRMSSTKKPII